LLRAALEYAARGWPVFPCKPGGKEPLTSRGHIDASTDPRRITAWWNRWPHANIGVPTGERSGLLVLDVDHPAGLDALEAEHGGLTATRTHATGNGGMHHLYRYPGGGEREIRNSAGKLAPGLDVRGEGGYVIAPPSATRRPYELLDDLPPVDLPEWLLEALMHKPGPRSGRPGGRIRSTGGDLRAGEDLAAIPEGQRNWTLYRLACSMRARGADEASMVCELEGINASRCSPPLGADELRKICTSAVRHAKGEAAPGASREVIEACDHFQLAAERTGWPLVGGATRRDVLLMLVKLARRYGKMIPAGVRVSVSMRTLALLSAVGLGSAHRAIKRLKADGWIRSDNLERHRGEAGAFVLVTKPEAKPEAPPREVEHSQTTHLSGPPPVGTSVPPLAPLTAPRLRWSAPVLERVEGTVRRTGTIRRLGKTCGKIVDFLQGAGGGLDLDGLYGRLYPHKRRGDKRRWRPRDLRRNSDSYVGPLARLEKAGVVVCDGRAVALSSDWLDALNREREHAGEIAAYRRDMDRYDRDKLRHLVEVLGLRGLAEEQIALRAGVSVSRVRGILKKPDPAPTEAEMDELRRSRPDGFISELEPVPDPGDEEFGGEADEEIVAALSEALVRWHDHLEDYPSWWASTLYVDGYLPSRPPPDEVARALESLRGAA